MQMSKLMAKWLIVNKLKIIECEMPLCWACYTVLFVVYSINFKFLKKNKATKLKLDKYETLITINYLTSLPQGS